MAKAAKSGRRPRTPAAEAAPAAPADEVAVLFPDIEVTVTDPETGKPAALTVREFRFLDGLAAQAEARDLIAALCELSAPGDDGEAEVSLMAVEAVIGSHSDAWLALCARATGRDADWLARLADADGREVTAAMWRVNDPFFVRRVVAALMENRRVASLFPSLASSTRSSAPATDAATPRSATH